MLLTNFSKLFLRFYLLLFLPEANTSFVKFFEFLFRSIYTLQGAEVSKNMFLQNLCLRVSDTNLVCTLSQDLMHGIYEKFLLIQTLIYLVLINFLQEENIAFKQFSEFLFQVDLHALEGRNPQKDNFKKPLSASL